MRRTVTLALVMAGVVLATVSTPAPEVRAAEPMGLEATVQDDGTWRLDATVLQSDGRGQSQVPVTFMARVDFFGERWIPVGTAVSDTTGTASLLYLPTWNGDQILVARAGGEAAMSSAPVVIRISGALPGVPSEPEDLPIVRAWAIPVGAAVIVTVWIILAFLFLSAVVGIRRAREASQVLDGPSQVDGRQTVTVPLDGEPRT